ncbi:glycosyltransferase family A protein [Sphingobacterium sp.]|uniref:glycosyltransferase family A protein n=1 Tax=Sphingobacterium sp. TaxID=341027 RepID=UPI0031D71FE9
MIPTIILNTDININKFQDVYKLISHFKSKSIIQNLKNAIKWAVKNDEDAIYCICSDTEKQIEGITELEDLIYELTKENIYFYYVDSLHESEISIDTKKSLLSEVYKANSFILTRPIYEYICSSIEEIDTNRIKLEQLFQILFTFQVSITPSPHISLPVEEEKIRIIAPFRNVENYLKDFLDSIEKQYYENYKIYFIDDCSIDGSLNLIPNNSKYLIKKNDSRKYALENILSTLLENQFNDNDIICLIDPDDKLPHGYVFNILNNIYSQPFTMLTYGSMRFMGSLQKFGASYQKEEFPQIRQATWKAAHLRTFRFKVFKELLNQDPYHNCFKNNEGNYLKMPYDMAFMFPLIEICGYKQIKFIDTVLYDYRQHPDNDMTVNKQEQYAGEQIIRSKKRLTEVLFTD